MNERLLQFIWQFQYFNRRALRTTEGEDLVIEKPGTWNHHQGPDFSEAAIKIGGTKWFGNVELHMLSSDWQKHMHDGDVRYDNIILHVVWEDDSPLHNIHGYRVPALVLHDRIPKLLLDKYGDMMQAMGAIPCNKFLPALDHLSWMAWKERLTVERMERKAVNVLSLLEQSNGNWEETCWWMLAANFGIRVNSMLFEQAARSLSLKILIRYQQQLRQLEALLMGQANLLNPRFKDDYPLRLQREYFFLRKKYGLQSVSIQPAFLRMRPAAFPTIRLSQLAVFLQKERGFFSMIKDAKDPEEILQLFDIAASDYWMHHYRFDEETSFEPKHVGKQMAENIMINTVMPVMFAYGLHTKDNDYRQRAVEWLYRLAAENNRITNSWKQAGVANKSALDSQALIELTNHYCHNKRCLDCAAGNRILRNDVL